jgi:ketosteroid isomerase-like protein
MSQENVEIVRSANDTFRRGDWDALAAIMDPDVLIRTDPSWPEQRAYGREAAIVLYRGIGESWGTDVSYEEIVDLGDRVLTRERWNVSGQLSGVSGALESSAIVTLREGLVILIEYFLDHEQALKAVGLET